MLNSASITRVGSRAIIRPLGQGGNGRVELAVDLLPGPKMVRLVVLKRILAQHTREQAERFEREARISLRLSHPVIAKTIDVESVDGELCLVQEYISGVTLALAMDRATHHQLKVELVLYVASEVARALGYLHHFEGGVLHRDVTPDNILLSYDGHVKLVDFGIAKVLGDETALTAVGDFAGRMSYVAPEVLAGGLATPKSDLYSLGIVMWEALTGRSAEGQVKPPSAFNPKISRNLDHLIVKLLSRDPVNRLEDAIELRLELSNLMPDAYLADRDLESYLRAHFNIEDEKEGLSEEIERLTTQLETEVVHRRHGRSNRITGNHGLRTLHILIPAFAVGTLLAVAIVFGIQVAHRSLRGHSLPVASSSTGEWKPIIAPSSSRTNLRPLPLDPFLTGAAPADDLRSSSAVITPTQGLERGDLASAHGRRLTPPRSVAATRAPAVPELLASAHEQVINGDYEAARALAARAVAAGGGGDAHLILGIVAQSKGHFSAAELEYSQASGPEAERRLAAVRKILDDLGNK